MGNIAIQIDHKDDMSMFIDKAKVLPCIVHGKKPKFFMINKSAKTITAECPGGPECLRISDEPNIVRIWNENNIL